MIRSTFYLLFLSISPLYAKRLHSEKWYQNAIANYWQAKTEVSVANGRVDIVGRNYASEVEFADKWKNAIGQSLWYSMQTGKKAGIILICESEKDFKHLIRLRSVIFQSNLDIKVWSLNNIDGNITLSE